MGSATVASVAQPEQEKRLLEGVSEQAKNTQKHETDAPADDSISSIRFHQIKSYASILSSGAHKLREVFKPKPAVESKENVAPQVIEFVHPALKVEEADPVPKPEIPGLVFKSSLSRRSSKKKKGPRSPSEEGNKEKENQSPEKEEDDTRTIETTTTPKNTPEKDVSANDSKENSFRSDETADKTKSLEKRNSMKRRNSKKKKESEREKKFNDEIDQALHEIQLMEKESQSKSNTNSLKSKRPSKKFKHP